MTILMPEHPLAQKNGYVSEHILIAEVYLERLLDRYELVHHINETPSDNSPTNLYVFSSRGEHTSHHARLRAGKEQPKVSNLPPLEEGEE